MALEIIGDFLELVGALLIAYTVLAVHLVIKREKSIDDIVTEEMTTERVLVILGMTLIVLGFIIRTYGAHFS